MKISATATLLLLILCCMTTLFGHGTVARDMPENVQPGNHFPVDLPENVQEKQPEMYPYRPHYPYHPRRYPPYYYIPPHLPRKCVSSIYEVRECVEDIIKSLRSGKYGPSKVCCKVLTDIKDACPHSDKNKFLHAAMLHHCPKKHHSNHH